MARSFDGATDRIDYKTGYPDFNNAAISIAYWINIDTVAIQDYHFTTWDAADTNIHILLGHDGTTASRLSFSISHTTTALLRISESNFVTGSSWLHFCTTWDGSTTASNIHMYKNGVEVGSYATTQNGSGSEVSSADGGFSLMGHRTVDIRNLPGDMAEVGIWNRVLSAGEIAALAAAYSPAFFPRGRIAHCPLIRETHDLSTGAASTVDGTTVATHPRIIYPGRRAA